MKNTIILIICFISTHSYSQDFSDTIITNNHDTIYCKITLVNEFNIFYKYNPKKKIIKTEHILRKDVFSFATNNDKVTIMNEQEYTPPSSISRLQYIESNGIIYSEKYETPPKFRSGLLDLNNFIINNTRVYPNDVRALNGLSTSILFMVNLDSLGHLADVTIDKSPGVSNGIYDTRHIESELMRVIVATSKWAPARIGGKAVNCSFYIPLKFYLEVNRVFLLSSKFAFSFKHRK